jgi:NAD(P)-dependent dehydrogenase (short-subunit alcohol dehydrogenase family)
MLPEGTFDGRVALVTGGGTGLGLACSRKLAALGAVVVCASRDVAHHETLLAEAAEQGWTVTSRAMDVREPKQVRAVVTEAVEMHGSLDILVNNAAGNFIRPSLKLAPKGWQAVIDIALSGVFYCSQAAGRVMSHAGYGRIVNVIAPYVETGMPGVAHSVAAKAGVKALTKTLASEWASLGIRVNAVSPGPFVSTGAADRLWPSEEIEDAIRESISVKRFGTAEEVADAVLYLASPHADFINGSCLTIDGGWMLPGGMAGDGVERVPRRKDA